MKLVIEKGLLRTPVPRVNTDADDGHSRFEWRRRMGTPARPLFAIAPSLRCGRTKRTGRSAHPTINDLVANPLFDQHMRVDATEAERIDGGSTRDWFLVLGSWFLASLRPRLRFTQDAERAVVSSHSRGGLPVVGGRRQRAVLEGKEDFHQARRTGSREQMADIRLHATDHTLLRPRVFVLPELMQAVDFHGVSDRCPGRVALDQIDIARLPPGLLVGRSHRAELPFGMRGEQIGTTIIRETDPRDDSINVIARRHRIAQTLEHKDARSFADDEAICLTTERRTATALRQSLKLREAHLRVLAIRARHSSCQHRIRAMSEQFFRGKLQRVERRRTGRIQRERDPTQTESLRDETRWQTGRVTIERMPRRLRVEG